VPARRVVVVVNSCDLQPLSAELAAAKHAISRPDGDPVRCLFLSSLIDTKGYPEYLDALGQLSGAAGPRVEAVLCGTLVASEFSGRFRNLASAEAWIDRRIEEINRGGGPRVRWIKGAAGADKAALFRAAEIFVLPTRYAVEAQPLVLLEAMASCCAIITTRIGEIPTILGEQSAVFLPDATSEALAAALGALAADGPGRRRIAEAAHARFLERYRVELHLDTWERLLDPARGAAKCAA